MSKEQTVMNRTVAEAIRQAKLLFAPKRGNQSSTGNASTTQAGLVPPVPNDATKFLNGVAPPAFAQVKGTDLAMSDVTGNNVDITKHGFCPKAPNDTTKFLRGDAIWAAPSGGSTAPISPDTAASSPNAADDEFEFGTALDTTGARRTSATAWAWVNQGTGSAAVAQGNLVLKAPAGSTPNFRLVVQPVSGTAWRYRYKMTTMFATEANFRHVAGIVRNSTSGKFVAFSRAYQSGPVLEVDRWNSPTSFSATNVTSGTMYGATLRNSRTPMWFEVELASGSLLFRYSDCGVDGTFTLFATEALTTFITSVDGIGLGVDSENSNDTVGVFDWFRRMA